MSTTHSKIGASSMYRWSACPGSVRLSEGIESKSSKYADEGTKAHELAAKWLMARKMNFQDSDFDHETKEAVEVYFNTVTEDAGTNDIQVEIQFDLSEIFPGLFGTSDAVVYDPEAKLLRVYDYKHGAGIVVEVENNSQLMYYGLGALLTSPYVCKEVELVIVQPRANHSDGAVRRWRFSAFDLVDFATDLENFALKTTDAKAPLLSGGHCRFCPAAGICPELRNNALTVTQTEFRPTLSYDPKTLSETLKKLDMLEGYTKSVREFAYAEAEQGRCPPGWKLVQKRAVRKWRDEEKVAVHWKQVFGEAAFDYKLKSPAQIEKLMGGTGGAGKAAVANECISISSGMTLVEESDPRPQALVKASDEFEIIDQKTEDLFN